MSTEEQMCFTVRLAEINGVSTVDGRVYKMDKDALKNFMDRQIGKPIGEIGTDAIRDLDGDLTQKLQRIETVDVVNTAGVLQGYDITEDGERLLVTGHVVFSPKLQEAIDAVSDQQPMFGLRALGVPSSMDNSFQIKQLISFDYVPPDRRL